MKHGTVLLLGDANVDTIMPVPEFPVPGRDGLATSYTVEVGGAVVNTAIMLSKLGQPSKLIGSTGKDIWAEYISRNLADSRIDTSHLYQKPEGATGLTFIITTPDGERTMFCYRGANTLLNADDITDSTFENAKILHISGYALLVSPQKEAVWHAVETAKKHGVEISLDTGLEPVIQNPHDLRALLPSVSVFISGRQEVMQLLDCSTPQQAADKLLSLGVKEAAIMMGKNGSLLADSDNRFLFPAFPVKAVDSTGAGDSFTAGLLFGRLNGLSLPVSGTLAGALGALAVMVYGAGFSLPDRDRVARFLFSMQENPAAGAFHKYIPEVLIALREDVNP